MVPEEAKKEVDRKNLKMKSWERQWNREQSCREGKGWATSQAAALVGARGAKVMLQEENGAGL